MAFVARYRPRFIPVTAVAVSALAFLLWPVLRLTLPILPNPTTAVARFWLWRVDEWTWSLGGAWLLLLVGLFVWRLTSPEKSLEGGNGRWPQSAAYLLLGGGVLAAVWAGSLAMVVALWLLLAGAWALVAWPEVDGRLLTRSLFWLLPGAFLVWWGAASGGGSEEMGVWSVAARTAVLLGCLAQMGAFPLIGWRVNPKPIQAETAVLLSLSPTLAGAALLLRLISTGPTPQILLVTLAGLLGLLLALWRAGTHLGQAGPLAAALALGQTSLLLLAGVWAGPAALAAEGRVLLLALGSLILLASRPGPMAAGRVGQLLPGAAGLLALAALAGWPLTAGWNGRAALYAAWLGSQGGWVLVLVTALLHVALVTAVFLTMRANLKRVAVATAVSGPFSVAVHGLWAIGLLALPARPSNPLVWAAVLLSGLGLLLPRWISDEAAEEWRPASDGKSERPFRLLERGRTALRFIIGALHEAATLPEGAYGLMGLLLLLALMLLTN